MPKLVLVEGKRAAGKSSVSEHIESLGFYRVPLDNYISQLKGPHHLHFTDLAYQIDAMPEFSQRFDQERGGLPYTMETALNVMRRNIDEIRQHAIIPKEDTFHIWYVLWDQLLKARDLGLDHGRVVIEGFTTTYFRPRFLDVSSDVEKYLVRLHVDDQILMQRLVTRDGIDLEKAQRRTARPMYSSTISPDVITLDYKNETLEDFEAMKSDLIKRLS